MNIPCRHFWVNGFDGEYCFLCSWWRDEDRNKYVRKKQGKKHGNFHTTSTESKRWSKLGISNPFGMGKLKGMSKHR